MSRVNRQSHQVPVERVKEWYMFGGMGGVSVLNVIWIVAFWGTNVAIIGPYLFTVLFIGSLPIAKHIIERSHQ